MGIGTSVGLLAAGAIFLWAVDVDLPYLDDNTLGAILLVAGAIGITISVLANVRRSHGPSEAGTGVGLLAAGAFLVWGLDVDVPYIYDDALGGILMFGGLVTIAATLAMHFQQQRSTRIVQRRY